MATKYLISKLVCLATEGDSFNSYALLSFPKLVEFPTILPKVSKYYTVTLKTSSGKVLPKQKVTIKVNGKNYVRTTNAKGQASLAVNFAGEKTYSVIVNYPGTVIYNASKATGKIVVSKANTKLNMFDRTFSKESQMDYPITLKDASGKVLVNQKNQMFHKWFGLHQNHRF